MSPHLRFITDVKHPNDGFSEHELEVLIQQVKLPSTYIYFLKVAGKTSNVLELKEETIEKIIQQQKELKQKFHYRTLFKMEVLNH